MHPLDVRRGLLGGTFVLLVAAVTNGARSDTPLMAFVETMAVGCLLLLVGTGLALAINRPAPNNRW